MITVAQAIVKCLENENVDTVFGIPGAAICPFYDALFKSNIKHILMRHEQNAGYATNGYSRIKNKAEVCIATSGPGALNLITAIATAYMDSVPMIIITGQVSSDLLGRDVFQEADITGAVEPFVKHSFLLNQKNDVEITFKSAFHIAQTGRKGPVLIDIPVDIQKELIDFSYPKSIDIRSYKPNVNGHFKQIERVISAISSSSKPILCIGGGVFLADAKKEVLELSNKCNIPIVSTMMGFSSVSTSNENFLGMIGMYGNETANLALNQADLVLLIGARVGDRAVMSPLGLCKTAIIIHIDIDPAEIGKNIKTDIPLVGDAKNILKQINSNITSTTKPFWITKTKKQISQTNYCAKTFFNELFLRVDDNATIVTDVGQNQIWAVNEFCVKNGRLLANGGMGAMGYAIPAGIGAIFADKNVQTISICGDGGFQMSMCELATITENHLPLKIVIINNNALGLVKEQQDIEYNKNEIGVIFKNNPSFTEIARACNIKAQQISSCDDFHFIDEMLNSKDAFLLEVIIDKDEKAITTI